MELDHTLSEWNHNNTAKGVDLEILSGSDPLPLAESSVKSVSFFYVLPILIRIKTDFVQVLRKYVRNSRWDTTKLAWSPPSKPDQTIALATNDKIGKQTYKYRVRTAYVIISKTTYEKINI